MTKNTINIIIVETSHIIYEGLCSILTKTNKHYNIHFLENISELQQINIRIKADLILINPALIQNQIKEFQTIKREIENTLWAGIVSTFLDQYLLSQFDGILYITDPPNKIISIIQKLILLQQQPNNQVQQTETLSERETEVLKLVVTGNANKEIAERLNISTNTVITHRKNITQKTGIKSVSGLTIYAVVNQIISIESYQE
jgi:DNA-binding CsgD family transcriptional regulator